MKRRQNQLLALCLVLLFVLSLFTGCSPATDYDYPAEVNSYYLDIDVDYMSATASCDQMIDYTNRTGQSLEQLYLHIYPNAFRQPATAPFDKYEWERAYPSGFTAGNIEIASIYINGKNSAYDVQGPDKTLLCINTDPIASGDHVEIEIEYILNLPCSPGRFGYGENTLNFGNAFPILCVYGDNGWNTEPYYSIGDPFYSDVANYTAVVSVDSGVTIASSGSIDKTVRDESSTTYYISAPAVRDFAFTASTEYGLYSSICRGVRVQSYALTREFGKKALEYATRAIESYTDLFGPYPYSTFTVAESDFFIGGMEYPNLVLINTQMYNQENLDVLEYVIAHEAAHQWWYGVVGNNEVAEPWVDESLTEYSTQLYYKQQYGEERAAAITQTFVNLKVANAEEYFVILPTDGIAGTLSSFKNSVAYDALVYGKGAQMFLELHQKLGDSFFTALRAYYENNRFHNATGDILIQAFSEAYGQDVSEFLKPWLYGETQ